MDPQLLEFEPIKRKQRIWSASLQAAIWTCLMFIWQYLTHRHSINWHALIVSTVLGGVVFGLLVYILPLGSLLRGNRKRPTRISIMVESDQVALLYQGTEGAAWLPRVVIHKGKIRSIFMIPGGIGISERSEFGARMLGFVAIPNTTPKFEELRALLESWKSV